MSLLTFKERYKKNAFVAVSCFLRFYCHFAVVYFSAMIALSCASVLASAIVLRVYHHNPKSPMPRFLKCLISSSGNLQKTGAVTNTEQVLSVYVFYLFDIYIGVAK